MSEPRKLSAMIPQAQKKFTKTTSSQTFKCDQCRDSGWIYLTRKDGREAAKMCDCRKDSPKSKALRYFFDTAIARQYGEFTFDDFLILDKHKDLLGKMKNMAIRYVERYDKAKGTGFYLYSNMPGNGKTMLACIIGASLSRRYGLKSQVISVVDALSKIKETYSDEDKSELSVINPLCTVDVLILDDIGTEKMSEWVEEKLYEIIEGRRSRGKTTLFTSNLPLDDLNIHDRIKSRIREMTIQGKMPDEDIRGSIFKERNRAKMNALMED